MLQYFREFCILLLLVSPVELRRASSGGGNRGQSASRGQVSQGGGFNQGGGGFNQGHNFQPQPNNFHPQTNNFHPQQPHNVQQPHGGFNQPNNFNRGPTNTFHGPVPPAKSSNTFAKALVGGAAGALGGILIYEAGKAIIKSATTPYSHNGREYYWDNNYKGGNNMQQCSMPLSQLQQDVAKAEASTTTTVAPAVTNGTETTTMAAAATTTPPLSQTINNLQFQDGTRPKQIVWGCKRGVEVCCGTDCCPAPQNNGQNNGGSSGRGGGGGSLTGVLVAILLIILIGGCCCCFIAYKMCRSAFDCILPREQKYDDGYQQNGDYVQHPQQQYPMQQYPSQQQYPPQQQYPQQQPFAPHNQYPQQGYPNTYPSQPTY